MKKTLRSLALAFLAALSLTGLGSRAFAALPATIDSDIYAYTVSPNFRTYFCETGRLQLHLAPHSTTRYVGTFLDYDGLRAYPAVAVATDPNAPVLAITGFNGTFIFKGDSNFGSSFFSGTGLRRPPGFPAAGNIFLSGAAHAVHTATYSFVLTERVGHLALPDFEYTGTMTIQYDANNRISGGTTTDTDSRGRVHFGRLAFSGYYSTSYLYCEATVNGIPFGISATFSGTSFSGNAVSGTGANTRIWVISGSPTP